MFPNILVELKRMHYSQKGLAAYVGMSEKSMSNKLNERSEFTFSEMKRIQTAFPECSLDYLFTQYEQKE